jgi:hypothetical protein
MLADLEYPGNDESLHALRDQVYDWLLTEKRGHGGIVKIAGKYRLHASMEGNALYATLKLGIADNRKDALADRLLQTQWPDGGWNCDPRPEANSSSFTETLIPLRALALYFKSKQGPEFSSAIQRASEFLLERQLFKRVRNGRVVSSEFVRLHYPCFWHYDILFALKVMSEVGLIGDRRCEEALRLLKSKRLEDGSFPADGKRYYRVANQGSGSTFVKWGPTGSKSSNPFVTVDALGILEAL